MSAGAGRSAELAQGLFIALAAFLGGLAVMTGDVTIPQSAFGGGLLILAGVCWAVATVLKARRGK